MVHEQTAQVSRANFPDLPHRLPPDVSPIRPSTVRRLCFVVDNKPPAASWKCDK